MNLQPAHYLIGWATSLDREPQATSLLLELGGVGDLKKKIKITKMEKLQECKQRFQWSKMANNETTKKTSNGG